MRKVIIITYHFPPRPTIGSVRMGGLAKYLPKFSWEPIILTPTYPGEFDQRIRILVTKYDDILTKFKNKINFDKPNIKNMSRNFLGIGIMKEFLIHKFVNLAGEFLSYPDGKKNWKPFAIENAIKLFETERIDAILSSSSPETVHLIAHDLKLKYGVPWVADFRDLWTQNPYYPYSPLRRWIDKKLELKTLSQADALITTSHILANDLKSLHSNKKVFTIHNGFDPEDVKSETVVSSFNITYTGVLYNGKRDPSLLFQCIKELIRDGKLNPKEVSIDFYGKNQYWLERMINRHRLNDIVRQYGFISREECLKKQRQSQILLLLNWNHPNEKGIYSGKIFEYLAARRPILSIGAPPGSVIIELLEKTNAGVHCYDLTSLKVQLLKFYEEYKLKGYVSYSGITNEIDKYSHLQMAKKFAEVLDEVSSI